MAFTSEIIQGSQLSNLFLDEYVAFDISGINDSTWTYFEGIYIANGGEQYVYLGSNTPNDELTCVQALELTWLNNASYVLVDNVSVVESEECGVDVPAGPTVREPEVFPNPATEFIIVSGIAKTGSSIKLFDCMGRLCSVWVANAGEASLRIEHLAAGTYLLQIEQFGMQHFKVLIE